MKRKREESCSFCLFVCFVLEVLKDSYSEELYTCVGTVALPSQRPFLCSSINSCSLVLKAWTLGIRFQRQKTDQSLQNSFMGFFSFFILREQFESLEIFRTRQDKILSNPWPDVVGSVWGRTLNKMALRGPFQTVFFYVASSQTPWEEVAFGKGWNFPFHLKLVLFLFWSFVMQLASISLMRELSCHFSPAKGQF